MSAPRRDKHGNTWSEFVSKWIQDAEFITAVGAYEFWDCTLHDGAKRSLVTFLDPYRTYWCDIRLRDFSASALIGNYAPQEGLDEALTYARNYLALIQ